MPLTKIQTVVLAGALATLPAMAGAAVVYQQTFSTDTATTAATEAQYGLVSNGLSAASAQGGVLRLGSDAGGQHSADIGSFVGDLTIDFDTNFVGPPGYGNTAFRVGDNNFVFHPGCAIGAGSFRIDGPGGHNNIGMGFTPLQLGMNHVNIVVLAATGITT